MCTGHPRTRVHVREYTIAMWIQFLRHKRIAAKGSTRGGREDREREEGNAFEKNPFAQIGWPSLASIIGVSLAIKKFCTEKKTRD